MLARQCRRLCRCRTLVVRRGSDSATVRHKLGGRPRVGDSASPSPSILAGASRAAWGAAARGAARRCALGVGCVQPPMSACIMHVVLAPAGFAATARLRATQRCDWVATLPSPARDGGAAQACVARCRLHSRTAARGYVGPERARKLSAAPYTRSRPCGSTGSAASPSVLRARAQQVIYQQVLRTYTAVLTDSRPPVLRPRPPAGSSP